MKLHRMSQDNKFFLFEDRYTQKYKVYQLKSTTQQLLDGNNIFNKNKKKVDGGKEEYEFVVEYEIEFRKSNFMKLIDPDMSWEV